MKYSYDNYGWLTSNYDPARCTDVVPPTETDTKKANWTGVKWVLADYVAPPDPDEQAARKSEIMARLVEIDRLSSSPRAQREALLGDLTWLTTLNTEAEALRTEMASL